MRHINPILFCIAFLCTGPSATAANNISLKQIQQMAASGTPGLALTLLDELHPGTTQGFGEWLRWNRARTKILVDWKQWSRAIKYLQRIPENTPDPLRNWALSQRAWLRLEQGDTPRARALLRRLLWRAGEDVQGSTENALLRRLVIRSYLIDDRIDDAASAMRRYQQDYPSTKPEWLQLRARILLRQRKPGTVFEWSAEVRQQLPPTLLMLAALRSAYLDPRSAYEESSERAANVSTSAADSARYWKIAAEASRLSSVPSQIARATERALIFADDLPDGDKIFRTLVTDLWEAYRSYGVEVGNRRHLLIGEDEAWFEAVESVRTDDPMLAKSLLVALAGQTANPVQRDRALLRLVELLETGLGDLKLVAKLFSDRTQFPNLRQVPISVRHKLVKYALSISDIVMASDLLATLTQQPTDGYGFVWDLRRARVLILGGHLDEGVEEINSLLTEQLFIDPGQLDKLMQVLFDLQAAGHHRQVLALFSRLETERQLAPKQRRELFFWMAESYAAIGQFTQAGLYYMRSATYTDSKGTDPWGRAARYNAAEALTKAGLVGDARRLYASLLETTKDPARRALLRGKMQQLWVSPADSSDVGN